MKAVPSLAKRFVTVSYSRSNTEPWIPVAYICTVKPVWNDHLFNKI